MNELGIFTEEDHIFLRLKYSWLPDPFPDCTMIDGRYLTFSGVPSIQYETIELRTITSTKWVAGKAKFENISFNSTLKLEIGSKYCIIAEDMYIVGLITKCNYYYKNYDYELSVDYFGINDGLI